MSLCQLFLKDFVRVREPFDLFFQFNHLELAPNSKLLESFQFAQPVQFSGSLLLACCLLGGLDFSFHLHGYVPCRAKDTDHAPPLRYGGERAARLTYEEHRSLCKGQIFRLNRLASCLEFPNSVLPPTPQTPRPIEKRGFQNKIREDRRDQPSGRSTSGSYRKIFRDPGEHHRCVCYLSIRIGVTCM